jgi:hypothetical protein
VYFTASVGGEVMEEGELTRAECDPNQAAWCVARLEAGVEIEPGTYTFRTERAAICQNRASGGNGFICAYGARVTVPAPGSAQQIIQIARDSPARKLILDAVRALVERTLGIKVVFVVDRMTMVGDWAFASLHPRDAAGHRINYRRTRIAKGFDPEQDSDLVGALLPTDVYWEE